LASTRDLDRDAAWRRALERCLLAATIASDGGGRSNQLLGLAVKAVGFASASKLVDSGLGQELLGPD